VHRLKEQLVVVDALLGGLLQRQQFVGTQVAFAVARAPAGQNRRVEIFAARVGHESPPRRISASLARSMLPPDTMHTTFRFPRVLTALPPPPAHPPLGDHPHPPREQPDRRGDLRDRNRKRAVHQRLHPRPHRVQRAAAAGRIDKRRRVVHVDRPPADTAAASAPPVAGSAV
jgi:hypothetical protein